MGEFDRIKTSVSTPHVAIISLIDVTHSALCAMFLL